MPKWSKSSHFHCHNSSRSFSLIVLLGIISENEKNRTLRLGQWP